MLSSTCTIDRKTQLSFKQQWTWLTLIVLSLLFVSTRPKPVATPLRVLIANMLFGRLEVFTLLVLFTPTFWRE